MWEDRGKEAGSADCQAWVLGIWASLYCSTFVNARSLLYELKLKEKSGNIKKKITSWLTNVNN